MRSIIEFGVQNNVFGYLTMNDVINHLYIIQSKLYILDIYSLRDTIILHIDSLRDTIMLDIREFTENRGTIEVIYLWIDKLICIKYIYWC
jgi:hypothetical protein